MLGKPAPVVQTSNANDFLSNLNSLGDKVLKIIETAQKFKALAPDQQQQGSVKQDAAMAIENKVNKAISSEITNEKTRAALESTPQAAQQVVYREPQVIIKASDAIFELKQRLRAFIEIDPKKTVQEVLDKDIAELDETGMITPVVESWLRKFVEIRYG